MNKMLKTVAVLGAVIALFTATIMNIPVFAADPIELYKPVLDRFYNNIAGNWKMYIANLDDEDPYFYGTYQYFDDPNADKCSYMWAFYLKDDGLDNAGYALMDLNDDGIEELLIGQMRAGSSETTLMEVYTIYNSKVNHLLAAGERDFFSIGSENEIIEEGSSGAGSHNSDYYHIIDGQLFCSEAIISEYMVDENDPGYGVFYGQNVGYVGTYDYTDMKRIDDESTIRASHIEKHINYIPFSQYFGKVSHDISSENTEWIGSCGYSIGWRLQPDGTLMINGYGEMYDYGTYGYDDNYAPWLDIESVDVKQIIIGDGVKTIGECSFAGLPVISVQLPESLQEIRNGAFHNCLKLKSLTIPEGVTTIANDSIATCGNGGDGVVEGFTLYGYRGSTAEEYAKNLNNTLGMDHKITFHTLDEEETFNIELSGNCGTSSHWAFDPNTGTLTISGTGDVTESGWNDGAVTRDEDGHTNLRRIVIEEGITRLMQESGMFGAELEEIQLPSTLTEIGDWYFSQGNDATDSCALHEIIIPASVTHIGDYAFCCNYSGDGTITTYYDDFVMKGYTGTEAESYAESNGIQFVALDSPDTEQPDSGQLETSPEIQTEQTVTEKKDSTISSRTIATICLVAAGVLLVIAGVYLWIKKR